MNEETRISPKEMMHQREQLIKQKEFLTDILSKIEKQILALQVERLHLRSTLLGSNTECPSQELSNAPVNDNCIRNESETNNLAEQKLDLSIPLTQYDFEEVEEDDESSS